MASNYNEEDVEEQQTIPDDNSTYNQLWQDALDIDEEVQRILQEHSMPINDDELEHAEEAQEDDDGMQWVILYFFLNAIFVFVQPWLSEMFFLRDFLFHRVGYSTARWQLIYLTNDFRRVI